MPTIDTSTIEGFEGMSAEQKVEALLKAEIPEKVDLSLYVSKDTADKYATEAAELKKQLKSRMTDDEAAKAQADADRKALEDKYTELLRKSTIAKPDGAGGGTEEKDEAVEFAKKLGKQRADALKNANEGLKHYF